MKPQIVLFSILLSLSVAASAPAQDSGPLEGYVVSLRSLYEAPDANSNTVGFLRPGEYVRLEHVHSLVYRVFRDESKDVAGYVVYPKLSENEPERVTPSPGIQPESSRGNGASTGSIRRTSDQSAEQSGAVTNYSTIVKAASFGSIRWVHQTSNIRAGTGTNTDIVAQLPAGSSVRIGSTLGRWAYVFRSDEDDLDPEHALGFVHVGLLKESPPAPRMAATESEPVKVATLPVADTDPVAETQSILQSLSTVDSKSEQSAAHDGHDHSEDVIVFVTKTGTKYHLETCRHLRKSRKEISLKEAKEKNYEACKTCKPDKKLAEAKSN